MGYNNSKNFQSFQFFKVQSYPGVTKGNLYRMIYGKPIEAKKSKSIIHYFKENGYITAQINDFCCKQSDSYILSYMYGDHRKYVEFDHELVSLNCSPIMNIKQVIVVF